MTKVENLDYIGPMPDISYYGVDEMGFWDRKEFLVWYEIHRSELFNNRLVLEAYRNVITVLRQACCVFRREFLQIGNIECFSSP